MWDVGCGCGHLTNDVNVSMNVERMNEVRGQVPPPLSFEINLMPLGWTMKEDRMVVVDPERIRTKEWTFSNEGANYIPAAGCRWTTLVLFSAIVKQRRE